MGYGTEANYCALALVIAQEHLTPDEACTKMAVPMTGRRTLTDLDRALIKEMLAMGKTYREIAGIYGKTERAIQKIISYKTKRERMEQNARA